MGLFHTGTRAEWAFDRDDNVQQADLGGGLRETHPARGSSHGLEDARTDQTAHQPPHERQGQMPLDGDLGNGHMRAFLLAGQVENDAHGVVGLAGDVDHRLLIW